MTENYDVEPIHKTVSMEQRRQADRVWLSVGGMDCSNCAIRVRNGLVSLEGVYAADVYLDLALAEVFYDRRKVSANTLQQAVRSASNAGRHEYHAFVIATEG